MGQVVDPLGVFSGKTVLVTGHTGFKGSWLTLWLHLLGAQVHGFALPPKTINDHFSVLGLERLIDHQIGDIRELDSLASTFNRVKPDFVFHLAAQPLVRQSYENPKETFDTNVGGSVNVLECVRNSSSVCSLIFVTSDKCYRNREWLRGYKENDELGGHDPYSASKAAAEIVFLAYQKSFFSSTTHCGIASVRAGNVVGGGDWSDDRIVPDCVRALLSNSPIILRNPTATRPWQHVLEPLFGYLLLAGLLAKDPQPFSGSWNFGPNDDAHSVLELATGIVSRWGTGSVEVKQSASDPHEAGLLQLDCEKATTALSWRPQWDFERTVTETSKWYKKVSCGEEALKVSREQIYLYQRGLS